MRKRVPSGALDFLYDAQGHKVAEVDTTGTFQRGELYAGDRHFAVFAPEPGPNGATFFTHSDWLGTERARTDMTDTVCETIKSLPFGDGQITTGNCNNSSGDVSPMHFTGKERDSESGLDNFGARYNASSFGRFMSIDPSRESVNPANPQSWNRYTYALDNPLEYVDKNGLWPTRIHQEIYEAVFGGVLTPQQIALIEKVSAEQDSLSKGGQDPNNANRHGQCTPSQSMSQCGAGISDWINKNLAIASVQANLFGLNDAALTYFAKAGHTLTDLGSPTHAAVDGTPTTWYGVFGKGSLAHVVGESDEIMDWYGIGQSVRNLIGGFIQAFPEYASKLGDPAAAAQKAIETIVNSRYAPLMGIRGVETQREMARQCALGNRAACGEVPDIK